MKYLVLIALLYLTYRVFFQAGDKSLNNPQNEEIEYTDYEEVD